MIYINSQLNIPLKEIKFTYTSSSGPGGQHVNKTHTKAVLRWNLKYSPTVSKELKELLTESLNKKVTKSGSIIVYSDKFRDRERNKSDCMSKFIKLLTAASKRKKLRRPTKITRTQKKKRLDNKKILSVKKETRKKIKY